MRSLFLALLLAGCDDDEPTPTPKDAATDTPSDTAVTTGTPPDGDPATVELAGECDLDKDYGGFTVEIVNSENLSYSTVAGEIANGVVPVTILQPVVAEGDCELLQRLNPFCDPPCQAGETCDFDSTCISFPVNQDLGTVSVAGLKVPVTMDPVPPGNNYFEIQLPHPVFQPGVLIEATSSGTTFGADFSLHGVGVDRMDVGSATEWIITDGLDLNVTWTPSTAVPARAHVHLRLNIDQHGNTPVQVFCEFEDDGEGTVPAALITRLIGFGVTGFPNGALTRRTVDQATMADGCIDFEVRSEAAPSVRVDGFIPCNSSKDCPEGQTCDPVSFICN